MMQQRDLVAEYNHDVEMDALRSRHDEMAKFLIRLLKHSDKVFNGKRMPAAEGLYQEGLRLVRQAGMKYP
jgi:hypothetical protein